MSSNKASFFTRLRRLCRLTVWLFKTGKNLRGIDGGCPKSRNRAVIALGKGALAALDIGLEVGRPAPEHPNGVLVAANHVSWLDIFAMSAVYPSSFIAKQEIKSWPVLGKMGQNAGTVFINRNSRRDIEPINRAVCETLQRGQNVSFFPEARTSSGLGLLPFKAALFQSAIDAGAKVLAVALRYYDETGKRTKARPSYADVGLPTCLWRIVSMKKLTIKVDFVCVADAAESEDRYALKDKIEESIRAVVAGDADVAV
ncbi:1-acyl-sn-glycerol-3-phosphate acyltransferase [Neisseria gonorrhoeae]|nr:1-acyl-sn-glycerol-3-phosphate acyltransferase [Neisseria gonorrhoeae]